MTPLTQQLEDKKKELNKLETEGGCLNCRFSFGRWALCQYCRHKIELYKSELKGRLDALKEVLNLDENGARDDDYLIINKNKIQEEIKMVESAGVGK